MEQVNGNKGVSGSFYDKETGEEKSFKIIPDDKMPEVLDGPFKGLKAEICLNPLGVVGRLNMSQLFEHELNFISLYIRHKIANAETKSEKEMWYFDFLKSVNAKQSIFTLNWYNTLSEFEQLEYLKECEEKIYIVQEPFFNKTEFKTLCDLYDKYPFIKPFNMSGCPMPLIMGELFFVRLKHDPKGKFSVRATGFENLKNSPAKSKDYKYKKSPHSTTPVRVGNSEILNLLLISDSKALSEMLAMYSTNEDAKDRLLEALLIGDPYDVNVNLQGIGKNENQKLVETLFFNLGFELTDDDKEIISEKLEEIEMVQGQ